MTFCHDTYKEESKKCHQIKPDKSHFAYDKDYRTKFDKNMLAVQMLLQNIALPKLMVCKFYLQHIF